VGSGNSKDSVCSAFKHFGTNDSHVRHGVTCITAHFIIGFVILEYTGCTDTYIQVYTWSRRKYVWTMPIHLDRTTHCSGNASLHVSGKYITFWLLKLETAHISYRAYCWSFLRVGLYVIRNESQGIQYHFMQETN
jgi:hypothetical protein